MKLIIEIDETDYKQIRAFDEGVTAYQLTLRLYDAVSNGTPLPKGHGRILDEKDILDTENNDGGWYDLVDMLEYIAGVKAIIEAEGRKERMNEDNTSTR